MSLATLQTDSAAGIQQVCHPAPWAIPSAWWPGKPLPRGEVWLHVCLKKVIQAVLGKWPEALSWSELELNCSVMLLFSSVSSGFLHFLKGTASYCRQRLLLEVTALNVYGH